MSDLDPTLSTANGLPNLPAPPAAQTVPKDRFDRQTQKLRETIAALESITAERDDLSGKVGTSEALASQVADLRATIETNDAAHADSMAMATIGLTDAEGQDLARFYYGRSDAAGRGTFPDWLKAQASAPEAAAKGLQPFLGSISTGTTTTEPTTAPEPTTTMPMPPSDRGVTPTPTAPRTLTTESIKAAIGTAGYGSMRDALRAEYEGKR